MRSPVIARPALAVAGLLLVTTACSDSTPVAQAEPPSYEKTGVVARVLPQLASPGEDTAAADDAEWVVDAAVEGASEGTEVKLVGLVDGDWETVDEGETDEDGEVALTTSATGDLHVISGSGAKAIGTAVATEDAPAPSLSDDFDEDTVDVEGGNWFTRDQGYAGVRRCSRASADAVEVTDGVLRLSVLDDPDRGKCTYKGKQYDYRLNGHVGSEGAFQFTHGFAAARIRMQEARGQHAAFWMQTPGGAKPLGQEKGGAEIDVVEYFGDEHPQGGLTSFSYWTDKSGKDQKDGGWLPDVEELGDDWSSSYHVFSVEWTPDEYVFRIDGKVTQRLNGDTSGQPEFLILSLLSSDYELKQLNGDLPQHMDVDWVRVWKTGD